MKVLLKQIQKLTQKINFKQKNFKFNKTKKTFNFQKHHH